MSSHVPTARTAPGPSMTGGPLRSGAAHLANKLTDALRFYRRYVAEAGANARRERIDTRIRECELAPEAAGE